MLPVFKKKLRVHHPLAKLTVTHEVVRGPFMHSTDNDAGIKVRSRLIGASAASQTLEIVYIHILLVRVYSVYTFCRICAR